MVVVAWALVGSECCVPWPPSLPSARTHARLISPAGQQRKKKKHHHPQAAARMGSNKARLLSNSFWCWRRCPPPQSPSRRVY
ncbi:hypothetical protein BRADI_2g53421v3 [Brachypodium distachyon]|uniref:Uncharacterized protein n=1 Tax=Brachypodium distachyon TaxID=15368 RepID=A0A2K2DFS8_BRADI|nr:hypothetical protein BRADI_2g53421v3 [Brachypodium distachyon]